MRRCQRRRRARHFRASDALVQLATKNDLYVIPTSWEYRDALAHVADPGIRAQILEVPYSQRLMLLARQYDRLLIELKKRGLHKRIAQVDASTN